MKIKITDSDKTLSVKDIKSFEAENKVKFPEAYQNFLLEHNGGYTMQNYFEVKKYGSGSIGCFMGVNTKEKTNDIAYALKVFKNRIPKESHAIARVSRGQIFIRCLAGVLGEL